jgi:hypothetical protein
VINARAQTARSVRTRITSIRVPGMVTDLTLTWIGAGKYGPGPKCPDPTRGRGGNEGPRTPEGLRISSATQWMSADPWAGG